MSMAQPETEAVLVVPPSKMRPSDIAEVLYQRTAAVLTEIMAERERQMQKWGDQTHENAVWSTILGEEYGEACHEVNDKNGTEAKLRNELIQTAAVAVSWIEDIDRRVG